MENKNRSGIAESLLRLGHCSGYYREKLGIDVVCSKTGPWKTSQEDISDQTRGKKKNGKTKNEMAGRF